jgi:predicted nuclease of predicted toxin-antitoxin system
MRFILDHDVDVAVGAMLRRNRHECWTAVDAGLQQDRDDDLTVYACGKRAVLVTHDREFSARRRRNAIGHHLWLDVDEWEAASLLEARLDEVCKWFERFADLTLRLTRGGLYPSRGWQ